MDRRSFFKTLGAASAAAPMAKAAAQTPSPPPNILFILLDDMGWTDLGCYGSDLYETPAIDRLAEEGMRFTDAYAACTVCSPSRAAVLTGNYPARIHLTDWIHGHLRPKAKLLPPEWTHHLPLEERTFARVLRENGYATAHVGKWHLGSEEYWPLEHGFDLNIGGYEKGQPPSYFYPYTRPGSNNPRIPTLSGGEEGEYLTDRLTDEAIQFIERNANRPFCLYLSHYAVHTPIQSKEEWTKHYRERVKEDGRHQNPAYAGMIHSVDEGVGRLLETLDRLNISDNTLIVFTSDNGGLMRITTNVPLRAGKGSAYEGGVRVPLIARWPNGVSAGTVSSEPVTGVDFFPTILEVCGAAPESVDGLSLAPLFGDPSAQLDRDAVYWHYPHYHPGGASPYGTARARDWKLVEFFEDDHTELYRVGNDISESEDLSSKEARRTSDMLSMLQDWRAEVKAQLPVPNPNYEPPE